MAGTRRSDEPLTQEQAERVYDILRDECGASEQDREYFISLETRQFCREFRFQGKLGFGGKFYRCDSRWYVSCYGEDYTPARKKMIEKANARLGEAP